MPVIKSETLELLNIMNKRLQTFFDIIEKAIHLFQIVSISNVNIAESAQICCPKKKALTLLKFKQNKK